MSDAAYPPEILDACCGGRMWWWEKNHPLAVYMDRREAPPGSSARRPNWSCQPSLLADFKDMPFDDESFQLGFAECWRVLAPGGTLVFKWAGSLERVQPHFPCDPVVGSRAPTQGRKSGLGTRWFVFYKPVAALTPNPRNGGGQLTIGALICDA